MGHYYSEFDPGAAEWLRELMKAGLIPEGEVDERDIREVRADDLRGFHAVHLFAGIGGWPYALRLAGWSDERPVWTGSCPCQPYSAAGKGQGEADERDLWPAMFRLIRERAPDVCFGEQVEGAVGHGWIDRVSADLEAEGYAVGSCVLGAHSVGSPNIRQRLYWVADATSIRRNELPAFIGSNGEAKDDGRMCQFTGDRSARRLAHSGSELGGGRQHEQERGSEGRVADRWLGTWADFDLIPCRDGKARRVEPGSFPLVDGLPGRVGLLRGYGNAICPQTAAAFVRAWQEVSNVR